MRRNSLLMLVIKGRMASKKPRGRPRMVMTEDLKEVAHKWKEGLKIETNGGH